MSDIQLLQTKLDELNDMKKNSLIDAKASGVLDDLAEACKVLSIYYYTRRSSDYQIARGKLEVELYAGLGGDSVTVNYDGQTVAKYSLPNDGSFGGGFFITAPWVKEIDSLKKEVLQIKIEKLKKQVFLNDP